MPSCANGHWGPNITPRRSCQESQVGWDRTRTQEPYEDGVRWWYYQGRRGGHPSKCPLTRRRQPQQQQKGSWAGAAGRWMHAGWHLQARCDNRPPGPGSLSLRVYDHRSTGYRARTNQWGLTSDASFDRISAHRDARGLVRVITVQHSVHLSHLFTRGRHRLMGSQNRASHVVCWLLPLPPCASCRFPEVV